MTPSISVIIPTFERRDVLARTLRHLAAQDYPADRYEVIVVDNSRDDTPDMVEAFAASSGRRIRVLRRPERLPAVKRNLGLRAAAGELVLFLNDDVWASPGFLRAHADAHAEHARELVAVLGHVEQSPEMPRTPFLEFYRPFAYDEVRRAGGALGWRYFWSMNISLRRDEMLGRNLVFHEDWAEIGHEDVELGWRFTRAGGRIVYAPAAHVEHYHPHTLDSACRLQESIGRGLRDLEELVGDPGLLERYGVFSWRNSPRAIARGLARRALFNRLTVPAVQRWLNARTTRSGLADRLYWKVMLHYTERGYREAPRRAPRPVPTIPIGVAS